MVDTAASSQGTRPPAPQGSNTLDSAAGALRVSRKHLLCFPEPRSPRSAEASVIKIEHQIAEVSCVITES